MRFYELTLLNSKGQILALSKNGFAPSTNGQPTFSSRVKNPTGNGTINNPAALNVEWDCPVFPFATPQGNTSLRIWGVGLAQIASNLNYDPVTDIEAGSVRLVAGMAPGLPLATAAAPYAGLIIQGQVYQAFGNWQGVNQTLELVVMPGGDWNPKGGVQFSWLPGAPLSQAIRASLSAAFPGIPININIATFTQSQSSVPVAGTYPDLTTFCDWLQKQTQAIGIAAGYTNYLGVNIVPTMRGALNVFDGTVPSTPIAVKFQDLIGQPTWIDPATVQIKTTMRADIQVGGRITLPPGLTSPYVQTTAAAAVPGAPARNASALQGTFVVVDVHSYANFRQPDADSWSTVINAVTGPQAALN